MNHPDAPQPIAFPVKLLGGTLILTGVVLAVMLWNAFSFYRNVSTVQARELRVAELCGTISNLHEVQTTLAGMMAATGDAAYERRHQEVDVVLEAATKEVIELAGRLGDTGSAAIEDSNARLDEMEQQAFTMLHDGKADRAKAILSSDAYATQTRRYAGELESLVAFLRQNIADNQTQQRRQAVLSLILAAVSVAVLAITWRATLGRLNQWRSMQAASYAAVKEAKESLRELNEDLEARVLDRTAELEKTHRELLETSRKAGMAEIATNVLHNVGNVLNSVNVSATLAMEGVRKSKAAGLAQAVALMREHQSDLGAFITTDARGKQLPGYLTQLSEHQLTQQEATVRELESLRTNIEHIKAIVAMQQTYAKVSGVPEVININSLVEDCLRLNGATLAQKNVTIVRELQHVPPMIIEKHKVLQILVNLVKNAEQACVESSHQDKRLMVQLTHKDGRVRISVMDNGIGIPLENLGRIFNQGFTTKKHGHGFGLHASALAANELGGSLSASSNGVNLGAEFVLELPIGLATVPAKQTGA